MPYSMPSYIAGGDISPSRFVKLTGNNSVQQCVAGDDAIGVSHEGTREAPIPGVTPLAAMSGESCQVYGADEPCEVAAGAAITAGAKLKSDLEGKAVPALSGAETAGTIVPYIAIARTPAAVGEKVKVLITRGSHKV